ncbi:MAG TPA: spore coat protein CotJB [Ruminococcaceae bacterium]|jgi:spore coat protein JB|nr:spore coat protein CotJB [Oscillospiraceae bacterium]HBQ46382.1 spore coat protein CotJB [Oscillospiraceae bacterium]HBT91458.1 spore coat protein CotJB [Oscillospiraceae bacterium]HCB90481.1 spore coat protein CotJB [Oscillospiraceae bacterium]
MSEQERLMRRISANDFAAWEFHLYLDTHPGDCEAANRLAEYSRTARELTEQYESAYGPLHELPVASNRWAWIAEPWPWQVRGEGK